MASPAFLVFKIFRGRRCCLKIFIWSSGSPPVQWRGTICAIRKEGIIGKIHVKLYEIWASGSEGDVVYRFYFS